jgi:nitroimidazol reductase NimA-like FMN-containing flavoprotein (pyridoxamine 5'-phosphate oxidase superfamily)
MKFKKSEINTVKRGAKKATYDKSEIYSILDETEICNIAFIYNKKPFVQPINFGRLDDKIYIHGSQNNRMTNALLETEEVCLNVMILDAMKLTRSAFHHSVNYRSVMVFGSVKELTSDKDKLKGLKTIINHFVPNRWEYCRKPNEKELKATRVLEITINTASAKIANTPPVDNKNDLNLDYWAGTIPIKKVYDFPISDKFIKNKAEIPNHILDFVKEKNNT